VSHIHLAHHYRAVPQLLWLLLLLLLLVVVFVPRRLDMLRQSEKDDGSDSIVSLID
jgi:hypothetical protein